jgi:hypothetical protein
VSDVYCKRSISIPYVPHKTTSSQNDSNILVVSIENGDLLAYPNVASTQAMKLDANYTWTSLQLSIPVNGGSSNAVTFTREASSSGAAGEWQFWGPYIFLYDSSKQLVSHFFSEPTNDTGVFNLLWNLSEEQQAENPSAVPVSLRTIAPLDGN